MTEEEAQAWLVAHFGNAAYDRLARFTDLVAAENQQQNLISPATIPMIWSRHIVDSAQLLPLAPPAWQCWLDIGTGGGFPGFVVALLAPERRVVMVEPRRKRAEFLMRIAESFGLSAAEVIATKVEQIEVSADVISARAVAPIENLLQAAKHCAKASTTWLLPRGRSAAADLAGQPALTPWMFHVEHSITDAHSRIIVLDRLHS